MKNILRHYIEEFNQNDEELYQNAIDNAHAYEWLEDRIPLLECSDKELEMTYYFRWWTYRKHVKSTDDGWVITEFLPPVPWAGKHNVINAAAGHHFYEGRWLRDSEELFCDYLNFLLDNGDISHKYSSWLLDAAVAYESVGRDLSVNSETLSKMLSYYERWEKEHLLENGMFWSLDGRDAMEFSISGTKGGKPVKGIRPTLNAYMVAEARAIAAYAEKLDKEKTAAEYHGKAKTLEKKMIQNLVFDGFFKAVHGNCDADIENAFDVCDHEHNPRELIGYIPYIFGIHSLGDEKCFKLLSDYNVFAAKTGLATADISHAEYLGKFDHECLWNGYVWPFATSQTLMALLRVIREGHVEYKPLFANLMLQYSDMHRIEKDGVRLPWIDEVMSPNERVWTARALLEKWGWQESLGGKERGKDYNHSTFCDLVISGIFGVKCDSEALECDPIIPAGWEYARLDNLYYRGRLYTITYDRTGERYGKGAGFFVELKA